MDTIIIGCFNFFIILTALKRSESYSSDNLKRVSHAHMRKDVCIERFCYGVKETVWKDENYSLLFYGISKRSLLRDRKYSIFSIRQLST